jgi:hypothetical protein
MVLCSSYCEECTLGIANDVRDRLKYEGIDEFIFSDCGKASINPEWIKKGREYEREIIEKSYKY